jgi:hypothetical protein
LPRIDNDSDTVSDFDTDSEYIETDTGSGKIEIIIHEPITDCVVRTLFGFSQKSVFALTRSREESFGEILEFDGSEWKMFYALEGDNWPVDLWGSSRDYFYFLTTGPDTPPVHYNMEFDDAIIGAIGLEDANVPVNRIFGASDHIIYGAGPGGVYRYNPANPNAGWSPLWEVPASTPAQVFVFYDIQGTQSGGIMAAGFTALDEVEETDEGFSLYIKDGVVSMPVPVNSSCSALKDLWASGETIYSVNYCELYSEYSVQIFDGTTWAELDSGSGLYTSIWADESGRVVVAGYGDHIRYFDGRQWIYISLLDGSQTNFIDFDPNHDKSDFFIMDIWGTDIRHLHLAGVDGLLLQISIPD